MRNKIVLLPFDKVPDKCFNSTKRNMIWGIGNRFWDEARSNKLDIVDGSLGFYHGFYSFCIKNYDGRLFFYTYINCIDFKKSKLNEDFLLLCANCL